MNRPTLETDYLVVGAGATAMAFVDTLIDAAPDATMLMVDPHQQPGGHWNHAYPFVRLHQPSAWYGVASTPMDEAAPDPSGFQRGATGAEVLAYFGRLMRERFLPTGRVRWLPGHVVRPDDDGSPHLVCLATGAEQGVTVRRKQVNATHARTEVPSVRRPTYGVAPGVDVIAPGELPGLQRAYAHHTVVGSGKTGMDACLWLLEAGVPPARIRWIVPRDAWVQDRANILPGTAHFAQSTRRTIHQFEAITEASSLPDLLMRLEQRGVLMRLDPAVEPSAYRCAIASREEMAQLRRITDVVRLGRLRAIERTHLVLERGVISAHADTLYVDCSAGGLQPAPAVPVFDGDRINLLMVSWCRPMFSAALIAQVESTLNDDAQKNRLCVPVPVPERPADWLTLWAVTLANAQRWRQVPPVEAWLRASRLNTLAVLLNGARSEDPLHQDLLRASATKAQAAAPNLQRLLASLQPNATGEANAGQLARADQTLA
ncbi:MAG: hypothetical protein C0443_04855 [Comamonadaceae bacterium]|nr:hypothetical protein [Comamonadaceae bacterium]